MTDLERVKFMADCNWKPANQYWRELYERSQLHVKALEKQLADLDR